MSDANRTQVLSTDPNRTQMGAPPRVDPNRTVMGSPPSLNATVTIKPVQCSVCKTFNPSGVAFCIDCGLIFDRALPDDAFGAPVVKLPMIVDANGKEQPVRPGENIVGREADISIVDGRVSRRHAKLTNQHGQLTLEDMGSTNGTKIDGVALTAGEKRVLKGGEKISLGGVEVQLALPGQTSANATAVFASNRTAAIAAPPKKETAPAMLVGADGEHPLRAGVSTFGRKSDNDYQVPDSYVSGRHGQIEVTEHGVYLTDLGSSNGTFLNGAKLAPNMRTEISPEDVIRLGSLEYQVRLTA
jgi:pSer/pThr/pTyr-binding forkhead associated (FHA) protein